jgi:hypothetical protein
LAHVEVLEPLFQSNLDNVKQQLLEQYGFGRVSSMGLEFGLTNEQTPTELALLNGRGHISLDPVEYGLILPKQQRASLTNIALTGIEFDKNGPPLPASGNAIVTLRVASDGAMRVAEHLYTVRSDAPRIWSWTYHFSDRSVSASAPSTSSLDLLNLLLKSDDANVKQKLASPPTWSDLVLGVEFTPQVAGNARPRVSRLLFKVWSDSLPAPDTQNVMDIRCAGVGAVVNCSPSDLAGRSNGYGNLYRIYPSNAVVTLQAPPVVGRMHFSQWEVIDQQSLHTYTDETIKVKLRDNTLIYCRYQAGNEVETEVVHTLREEDISSIAATATESVGREAVVNFLRATRRTAAPAAALATVAKSERFIRTGANADSPVIGFVPKGLTPTVLEAARDRKGWDKVLYRGVIGYMRHI